MCSDFSAEAAFRLLINEGDPRCLRNMAPERVTQTVLMLQAHHALHDGAYEGLTSHMLRHSKLLTRVRQAALSGNTAALKQSIYRTLRSFSSRVTAVSRVAFDGQYEGLAAHQATLNGIRERADGLDCFARLTGVMRMSEVKKDAVTSRYIHSFSGNVHAAGVLVRDVLLAANRKSAIDFTSRGGRPAAAREIKSLVQSGYRHWLVFDIKNFFPSIRPGHLRWKPFPEKVLLHCVFPNEYLHIEGKHAESVTETVRRGLPVGAVSSPNFASVLMEEMLQPFVGDNCRVISYVDDVAIGACSPGELEETAKAIKDAVENHSAGPFQFKHIKCHVAEDGFDFLNFGFCGDPKNGCNVTLAAGAFARLRQRLFDRFAQLGASSFDRRKELAADYVTAWVTSHSPISAHLIVDDASSIALQAAADFGTPCQLNHKPLFSGV